MNFGKKKSREDPEINLIPFIDVLLVVLIFLMVTTSYNRLTQLQMTLPTADAPKMEERPADIIVGISADGRYMVNGTMFAFTDIGSFARELTNIAAKQGGVQKNPVLVISADSLTAHQYVVNILEAARQAGLLKVTFAAQTNHAF